MSTKKIIKETYGQTLSVGPLKVRQPLPAADLQQVSPFLLLHHAMPVMYEADGVEQRLSPHPHRGFEPVTFLFNGGLHHKDSLGNEGFLESGDVQWMTAGSGIIHSEGPSDSFVKRGGLFELIQLWVNLPRDAKMTAPKYQDIKAATIPVVKKDSDKMDVRVVAGTFEGVQGPASTFTPILALMLYFEADADTTFSIPHGMNTLLYLLEGNVQTAGTGIQKHELVQYSTEGETIELKTFSKGHALLLAGAPINEPVVSYGPFVMNYPGEIKQAMLDYETGKMGVLES
ncbi:MAG TPA: pirin family protein [Chitinophagaceae bacterium]|nr:pirin family protein [Chitinophagaceae bacterium]